MCTSWGNNERADGRRTAPNFRSQNCCTEVELEDTTGGAGTDGGEDVLHHRGTVKPAERGETQRFRSILRSNTACTINRVRVYLDSKLLLIKRSLLAAGTMTRPRSGGFVRLDRRTTACKGGWSGTYSVVFEWLVGWLVCYGGGLPSSHTASRVHPCIEEGDVHQSSDQAVRFDHPAFPGQRARHRTIIKRGSIALIRKIKSVVDCTNDPV